MDTEQRSPDDVLRDHLPDDLLPGRLRNGDLRDLLDGGATDDADDWGDGLGLIVDDDHEALAPVETNGRHA
jgi:hypothetical protein